MSEIITTLVGQRMSNIVGNVIKRKVGTETHRILVAEVDLDTRLLEGGLVKITKPNKDGRGGGNESVATTGGAAFLPGMPSFGISMNVWNRPE